MSFYDNNSAVAEMATQSRRSAHWFVPFMVCGEASLKEK